MPDFPSFTPHLFAPGEHALDSRGRARARVFAGRLLRLQQEPHPCRAWRLKEWDFYQISDDRLCSSS
jgi:hypothetical protein